MFVEIKLKNFLRVKDAYSIKALYQTIFIVMFVEK